MNCQVAIVADDLTGALDIAGPFAARGLTTTVVGDLERLPSPPPESDVVVFNTASRELTAEAASLRVKEAVKIVSAYHPAYILKKADTRLQGHVGVEVRAMLQSLGWAKAIVCPAAPRLGRFVRDGAVVGTGVHAPINVAGRLNLPAETVEICDADNEVALAALASRCGKGVLGVGAHGLGHALAQILAPEANMSRVSADPPMCFAIASRDPITAIQVDVLKERHEITEIKFRAGRAPPLRVPSVAVPLFRCVVEKDEDMSRVVLAQFSDQIVLSGLIDPYSTMLVCGGETAHAIIRSLDIAILQVLGEFDHGIPVAIAKTPVGRTLKLLTKSGGFGAETVLADIASWALGGSVAGPARGSTHSGGSAS